MSQNEKKPESKAKTVILCTVCLLMICLVVTGAVSGANYAFADKIAEQEWAATQTAMTAVLAADDYEEIHWDDTGEADGYRAITGGETAGYLFITAAKGYGPSISILTGIADGAVTGIAILDCSDETPGLGKKVDSAKFTDQFIGVTETPAIVKVAPSADNEIQAITGATKSTKGVTDSVSKAFELYAEVAE